MRLVSTRILIQAEVQQQDKDTKEEETNKRASFFPTSCLTVVRVSSYFCFWTEKNIYFALRRSTVNTLVRWQKALNVNLRVFKCEGKREMCQNYSVNYFPSANASKVKSSTLKWLRRPRASATDSKKEINSVQLKCL